MRFIAISVAALSFLLGTAAIARADCTPAAIPIGDAALVQGVTERLAASGVSTVATEGCPAVRVHLERRGPQLHLRVADGYQRRGEREVRDIATAAAVIESWTLQEVEEGALPELAAPAVVTAIAPAHAGPARLHVALAGRSSVANDGTAWLGGELAGCLRVRWWCLGAATSLAVATSATADATRGSRRSSELDVMVTLDVPRTFGRFTVSPGIGLGYGWMSFAQQHSDMHLMPLSIEYTSHALRTRAHVTLARRLGDRMAVFGGVFGDAAALRTAIPDGPTSAPRAHLGLAIGLRVWLR